VVVDATVAGPATVILTAGEETYRQRVDLAAGRTTVAFSVPADRSGGLPLTATVVADRDLVPDNDSAEAIVRVLGPPRVAVIEGVDDEAGDLVRALQAGNVEVDLLPAVPGADDLLTYDAVILVNLPAPPDTVAADLASFVGDLGRGLVVVGGDRAFGLGGYQETDLEDLLPVTSDPDDLVRRQPVAEVLVIDTSGSMADCHCSENDPTAVASDINKTDISRAGAGLAISALQPTDRVGVLAFTTGTRWALPFGTVPAGAEVAAALNTLVPEGDTEIAPALREALATLRDADEEVRHIVLFTDGWADDPTLLDTAEQIADAGITLSVLGTGEGTGETLRRMAALGGGRYYPGRDLESVPEVFVEETLRVARPLVAEGSFFPSLGAASQVTAGLTAAPPLTGYVLTRSKPTAQVALEIGPGDPLLVSWQRGLGRATVWTSDATVRWSADWVPWEGFVDFWGRLVRDVLPPGLDTPPEVRIADGAVQIRFEAEGVPLDAAAVVQVRAPDGTVSAVPMQRTGETEFVASVPAGAAGAYWAAVRVESGSGVVAAGSGGAVAGYPDEFAFRSPDPALAADLAGATGGRVSPEPAAVFDAAPARGEAALDLWPWLSGVALALFLVDVALRRLVLAKGDFRLWKEAFTPPSREPVSALETPTGPDAPPPSREVHPEEETLGRLLKRKRT
jgi:Mg-chelatase subunit ChlD